FNEVVSRMRGSFEDALNGIATGRDFGFSLTEKVYSQFLYDGKTYVGISGLVTRNPVTFDFYTDEYGMLKRFVQRVNGREQELEVTNFIHYVHSPEFDRYFGRSDLREAYRSWFAKDNLVKMWLIYLERLGGGFAVAKRTAESTMVNGTPEYIALRNMLTNIKSAAGIILPKGVEIEVIMPQSTDQYQQAIVYHDLAIAKALLVPNLLGISHAGQTGSYSQSQTQFDAFVWTLNADSKRLESCLNEQLFRDIGDQNFGDDQYPEFCFKPASLEHMKWTITAWKEMVTAGAVTMTPEDESYIRSLLDMPEKEEVYAQGKVAEDALQPVGEASVVADPSIATDVTSIPEVTVQQAYPQQAMTADPSTPLQSTALNGAQITALLEIVSALNAGTLPRESAKSIILAAFPTIDISLVDSIVMPVQIVEPVPVAVAPPVPPSDIPVQPMSRIVAHTHDGMPRNCTKVAFDKAVQRVQFAVIEQKTNSLAKRTVGELALRIAKAVQYAVGDPTDYMLEPTRIQDAKLSGDDIGKLKQISINALTEGWTIGSTMGAQELAKAKNNNKVEVKTFASLRGKAADYFEANGFRMAGNMSDGARAIIQQELQLGVKSGRSPQETKVQIWDRLVNKGFTNESSVNLVEDDAKVESLLNDLWVDTEEAAVAYLNTLVTTNTFEALNEARYAEFTDPALGTFVEGLEYSAVLDESTTQICSELNGVSLNIDNPAWDELRPPNHYNCRSLLIPITSIDGWDGVESEIPDVQPQDGF
ncbi:Phage head morphogenesis domain, partial [uncultured Caudovirales phage]